MTLRLLPLIVPALLSPASPSEHHDTHETADHEAVPRSGPNWILIGAINLGLFLLMALGIWLWRRSAKKTINQLLAEAKTA